MVQGRGRGKGRKPPKKVLGTVWKKLIFFFVLVCTPETKRHWLRSDRKGDSS